MERYIKIQQISKSGEPNIRFELGGRAETPKLSSSEGSLDESHSILLPTLTREEKTEIQSELMWEIHERN